MFKRFSTTTTADEKATEVWKNCIDLIGGTHGRNCRPARTVWWQWFARSKLDFNMESIS